MGLGLKGVAHIVYTELHFVKQDLAAPLQC